MGFPCLIATLLFSLQHATVSCSIVVLLNLNPLLIASCSNPLRTGILHFQLLLHYCWISLFQSWYEEKKENREIVSEAVLLPSNVPRFGQYPTFIEMAVAQRVKSPCSVYVW